MKSDIIDITVQIRARTERAIFASADGDKSKAEWLPLSQIEVEMGRDGTATITLPEWLATEKGLVWPDIFKRGAPNRCCTCMSVNIRMTPASGIRSRYFGAMMPLTQTGTQHGTQHGPQHGPQHGTQQGPQHGTHRKPNSVK